MKKEESLYKKLIFRTLFFMVLPFLMLESLFVKNVFTAGSRTYQSNVRMQVENMEKIRKSHMDSIARIVNRIESNEKLAGFFLVEYTGSNLQYYSSTILHIVKPDSAEDSIYTTKVYYSNKSIPRGFRTFYQLKDISGLKKIKEFLDSKDLSRWVTPYEAEEYSSVFTQFQGQYTYLRKVVVGGKLLYLITVSVPEKDMDSFAWKEAGNFLMRRGSLTAHALYVNESTDPKAGFPPIGMGEEAYVEKLQKRGKRVEVVKEAGLPQDVVMIFDQNTQMYNITAIMAAVVLLIFIFVAVEFLFIRKVFKSIYACVGGFEESLNHGFKTKLVVHGNNEISKIERTFNLQIDKIQELLAVAKSQVELVKDSQLQALQHQINPHFLYNTMEVFSYKMELYKHYEEADAIVAFSNMMRYNIGEGKAYATIGEELEQVSNYLCIQMLKLQKIEFENRIPKELLDFPVLRFLLQPLIENSIVHGYYGKPLYICLSCQRKDGYLRFEVFDNGIGIACDKLKDMNQALKEQEKDKVVGIGLNNINSRLQLFYSKECGLALESQEFQWTRIVFSIPDAPPRGE